jgi:hypothetical protein
MARCTGLAINQPLAAYRQFAATETNRLARSAENLRDFLRLANVFNSSYTGFDRMGFKAMVAHVAAAQARRFQQLDDYEAIVANDLLFRELQ